MADIHYTTISAINCPTQLLPMFSIISTPVALKRSITTKGKKHEEMINNGTSDMNSKCMELCLPTLVMNSMCVLSGDFGVSNDGCGDRQW